MDPLLQAVEAARLLGRWTRITERHAGGCSCCPGLGEVGMDEVEAKLVAWLAGRHPLLARGASLTALLRDCIAMGGPPDRRALAALLADLAEALDDLERMQAGLA